MVNEVERKIVKGKQRLALSGKGESSSLTPAQTQKNQEQINLLNERINGLVEEAEQAGNEGNVEQAQGLMKLCDQLKEERDNLKKQNENRYARNWFSVTCWLFTCLVYFAAIGVLRRNWPLLRRNRWRFARCAGPS